MDLHDLVVEDDLGARRSKKSVDAVPVDPTDIVEWWVVRATRSRALDDERAQVLAAARA